MKNAIDTKSMRVKALARISSEFLRDFCQNVTLLDDNFFIDVNSFHFL